MVDRSRWKNNSEMDHKEMGHENVDWIHLAHNRYQSRALGSGEGMEFLD
jgi:hypothetical protein